MEAITQDRIERVARIYRNNQDASRALEDLADIELTLTDPGQPRPLRRQLIRILGSLPSNRAMGILLSWFDDDDDRLRGEAYDALLHRRDRLGVELPLSPERLTRALERETDAAYLLHLLRAEVGAGEDGRLLLNDALTGLVVEARDRLVALLDMLHPEISGERVRQALVSTDRQRAAAVELIDNVVGRRGRDSLLPLFGPPAEALQAAHSRRRPETSSTVNPLQYLARSPDDWIRSCVLFDIGWRRLPGCEEVVEAGLSDPDARVRETALFALHRLSTAQRLGQRLQAMLSGGASDHAIPQGESPMALSLLEKVFFLKSVSLFEHIPGEEIVGIVPILREVEIEPGVTFIRKGEEGDCLYIIVEGEVIASMEGGIERVSSSREVIGELAVLAEQPRSADCSARTRVVALRIDKADFWRLMNEQPQITIEVMKVVVGRYLPGTAA